MAGSVHCFCRSARAPPCVDMAQRAATDASASAAASTPPASAAGFVPSASAAEPYDYGSDCTMVAALAVGKEPFEQAVPGLLAFDPQAPAHHLLGCLEKAVQSCYDRVPCFFQGYGWSFANTELTIGAMAALAAHLEPRCATPALAGDFNTVWCKFDAIRNDNDETAPAAEAGAASAAEPAAAEAGAASAADEADAYLASLLAERMDALEAAPRASAPIGANPWAVYRRTAAPAVVAVPDRLSVHQEFQVHVLLSMVGVAPESAASAALQLRLRQYGSTRQVHTVHRMRGAYRALADGGFDRSASRRTSNRERARYVALAKLAARWYNEFRLRLSSRELRFWQPQVHATCGTIAAPPPL